MTLVAMGFCFDKVASDLPKTNVKLHLIAVCDTLLSSDHATVTDSGVCKVQKAGFLGPWLVGYTGDPELFLPLRARLAARLGPLGGEPEVGEDELTQILGEIYLKFREDKITEQYLKPWNIESVTELRGMEQTNPQTYKTLWSKVDSFDLGIELCIGGWSQKSGAQLRRVVNPGMVSSNLVPINPGTVAIGAGAGHADAHLRSWYDKNGPIKEAAYYLLEAKLVADLDVPCVGAESDLIIIEYNSRAEPQSGSYHVTRENTMRFREAWEAERRNPSASLIKILDIEPLFNF